MAINYDIGSGFPTNYDGITKTTVRAYAPNVTKRRAMDNGLVRDQDRNVDGRCVEYQFDTNNTLPAGASLVLTDLLDGLSPIIDAKLRIYNPTVNTGLGASSQFSIGLAQIDRSQMTAFKRSNLGVSTDNEYLPIVSALTPVATPPGGTPATVPESFVYNPQYFLSTRSGQATGGSNYILLDTKDMPGFYYDIPGIDEWVSDRDLQTVIVLTNQGSAAISQGLLQFSMLFLKN